MQEPAHSTPESTRHPRIVAFDALRGWLMLLTVSGEILLDGIWHLSESAALRELFKEMAHSPWHGITYYDMGLPAYVLVMGASLGIAVHRRRERRTPGRELVGPVLRRAVILFALGILCNGGLQDPWPDVRLAGALQRLAICYAATYFLAWNLGWRALSALFVATMLGYWAMLEWVPFPGGTPGAYEMHDNLAAFVDSRFLPGAKYFGTWDSEGILSSLPAIATCVVGVLIGRLFLLAMPESRRFLLLAAIAVVSLVLAKPWSWVMPFNKPMWTSSFAMAVIGVVTAHLILFHFVAQWRGGTRLLYPLVVYGRNSLAAFVGDHLIDFREIALRLVGGSVALALGAWAGLGVALAVIGIQWALLFWLDRRKVHISI